MSLPGQRQYHLWEECPVAIASNNNAVHLQYPSPHPSPNLWPCSSQPTLHISTVGCYTSDLEEQAQRQVRHFRLYCLLPGCLVNGSNAFLRQNGEKLSVVLIRAVLISLLSAIGGLLFRGERRRCRMGCLYDRTLKAGKLYLKTYIDKGKCTKHVGQHISLGFYIAMLLQME